LCNKKIILFGGYKRIPVYLIQNIFLYKIIDNYFTSLKNPHNFNVLDIYKLYCNKKGKQSSIYYAYIFLNNTRVYPKVFGLSR